MLDIHKDYATLLKVALKGSEEALQRAYRRSIRRLAEIEQEFGSESQPRDLEFRWEWIAGYRVLTIITDGTGIIMEFSDIPGITEYLWLMHDDYSLLASSNDIEGVMLNNRETFNIPNDWTIEIDAD